MNWDKWLGSADVKVLLYLQDHNEARYADLLKNVGKTRGALASSLHDLRKLKLIDRAVEQTTPVQTRYKLTEKGAKVAQSLVNIQKQIL